MTTRKDILAGREAEEKRTKKSETRIFYEGQRARIAGKPIYINPYMGDQGQIWFRGYRADTSKPKPGPGNTGILDRVLVDLTAHPNSTLRDIANRLSVPAKAVNSALGSLQRRRAIRKGEAKVIDHKNRPLFTYVAKETKCVDI